MQYHVEVMAQSSLSQYGFTAAAVITALLLSAISMYAQTENAPIVLSNRTGAELVRSDRDYFGLFPSLNGFQSARFTRGVGNTIRAAAVLDNQGSRIDTTIILADSILPLLRAYIDGYEELFESPEGEAGINWMALRGMVRPMNPIGDKPAILEFTLRGNRTVEGTVVYADERAAVIVPRGRPTDPIRIFDFAEVVVPIDIIHVRDLRSAFEHLFSDVDIAVEGNDTVYREVVLRTIARRAMYHSHPSPELRKMIDVRLSDPLVSILPPTSYEELTARVAPPCFHFIAMYGSNLSPSYTAYTRVDHDGKEKKLLSAPPDSNYLAIGAEYSLFERVRLGAIYYSFARSEPWNPLVDGERFYSSSVEGIVRAIVVAPKRYFTDYLQRIEVFVGAGAAWQFITVETNLASLLNKQHTQSFTREESLIGSTFLLGGAYYFTRFLSLQLEGRFTDYPDIRIETLRLYSQSDPDLVVRMHHPHTISFTFGSVHVGFHVHL